MYGFPVFSTRVSLNHDSMPISNEILFPSLTFICNCVCKFIFTPTMFRIKGVRLF